MRRLHTELLAYRFHDVFRFHLAMFLEDSLSHIKSGEWLGDQRCRHAQQLGVDYMAVTGTIGTQQVFDCLFPLPKLLNAPVNLLKFFTKKAREFHIHPCVPR